MFASFGFTPARQGERAPATVSPTNANFRPGRACSHPHLTWLGDRYILIFIMSGIVDRNYSEIFNSVSEVAESRLILLAGKIIVSACNVCVDCTSRQALEKISLYPAIDGFAAEFQFHQLLQYIFDNTIGP